jgi:hypothetical protein
MIFLQMWWKELVVAAVVAGGIWYVHHLQTTVEDQAKTIAVQEAQATVLKANQELLQTAIDATNKSFERIDKVDKLNKDQFAKLQTTVSASSDALAKRLTGILAGKKPVTCEETIQYLIDASKGYSK